MPLATTLMFKGLKTGKRLLSHMIVVTSFSSSQFSWTGVAMGAVLMGLGVGMALPVEAYSTPRHYGVCVSQTYAGWKHTDAATTQDRFHGNSVVLDQLIWLVQKGSLVLPDEPIRATCRISCRITPRNIELGEKLRIVFVGCADANPPSILADLPRGMSPDILNPANSSFQGSS